MLEPCRYWLTKSFNGIGEMICITMYRPAPINPIAIQIIGRLMETGIDIYYTALP